MQGGLMRNGGKQVKKIVAGAIGDCVHVAGIHRFLEIARQQGFETRFLGPAVSVEGFIDALRTEIPDLVGVSYRLSPEAAERLLRQFRQEVTRNGFSSTRFAFGGTPPVVRVARRIGIFERAFDGSEGDGATIRYLSFVRKGCLYAEEGGSKGLSLQAGAAIPPQTLVERIRFNERVPLIRHHFGLPSLQESIQGVHRLAEEGVLDVISLGIDQNAQEHFFCPDEIDENQHGAGGIPVRCPDDFRRLYESSRCGNYPLMRCYSGTRNIIKMAEMLQETINQAWGAIPLMWYSLLDGRSRRPLIQAIEEAQEAYRWHARHGIPVECNEAHHWSLRNAPDQVAVAAAFLGAYNCKAMGVTHYVAQYMFNSPPGISFRGDLAKMLAKVDLVESLQDEGFRIFRQTRAGLASLSTDPHIAKGQLASSVVLQLSLRPHIVHVVAHVEADHAATAQDIAEAVKIVRGVMHNVSHDFPDLSADPEILKRKEEIIRETKILLNAIRELGDHSVEDPWTDPQTLARAVRSGLLDAPHLSSNPEAKGEVRTGIIGGRCVPLHPNTGLPMTEEERVARILQRARRACGS